MVLRLLVIPSAPDIIERLQRAARDFNRLHSRNANLRKAERLYGAETAREDDASWRATTKIVAREARASLLMGLNS